MQKQATHQQTKTDLNPPLKWAGGKRWLAPLLAPVWRQHQQRRLVEPFVGGLAISLGLNPAQALLYDSNPHLINFYRWLQRGLVTAIDMRYDRDLYYQQRARFNDLIAADQADSKEAAELFYYLNRSGFNGLCRFNGKGRFNVPFGRHTTVNYTHDFSPYAAALAGWEFSAADFSAIVTNPADFIYADPPYDVPFTNYSSGGFSWPDQIRLAEWLARHPGPVIASNQATPRIISLYSSLGFTIKQLSAPRMISRTGDRTPAIEMLALRNIGEPLDQ